MTTETTIHTSVSIKSSGLRRQVEEVVAAHESFELTTRNGGSGLLLIFEFGDEPERDIERLEKVFRSGVVADAIAISAEKDPDLIIRSMRAGVREFLSVPLDKEELTTALDRVAGSRHGAHSQGKGRILSVCGVKGGVGTTTIAVNLAHELNLRDPGSVCLVDFQQPHGEVPLFLDLEYDFTWGDAARNIVRLDATYMMSLLARHDSGLYVLPAPGVIDEEVPLIAQVVRAILPMLAGLFPTVIVDVRASLGEAGRTLVSMSNDVLLVTALSLPCLVGSKNFLSGVIGGEDENAQVDKKFRHIANRYLSNSEISLDEAEEVLGAKMFWKVPNDYSTTLSAINQGRVLSTCAPRNPVTKAITELADQFAPGQNIEIGQKRGIFSGISGLFSRSGSAA